MIPTCAGGRISARVCPMKRPMEEFTAFACVAGAAMVGYWAWRYEGLYRWLAEWQLRTFGSYEVQLTFIGALAIVVLPIVGVAAIVRKLGPGKVDAPPTSDTSPTSDSPPFDLSTAIQIWLGR